METRSQKNSQSLSDAVYQSECVTHELHKDLEYDRDRCLDLQGIVKRLSSDCEIDHSQYAFTPLENERAQRSLRDKLGEVLQDISHLRGEISKL